MLGAGKSTLGNLLLSQPHDEGPFYVSADMASIYTSDTFNSFYYHLFQWWGKLQESVTKECCTVTTSIDGVKYNIVDTPGIFDTQQVTDEILKEIAETVQKCTHGVKAILFVFGM